MFSVNFRWLRFIRMNGNNKSPGLLHAEMILSAGNFLDKYRDIYALFRIK